jgi:Tfp pilus assembly protein PilX
MRRQRGGILFAVALMLAVIGALALAMSREGAMAAQSVEAEYDTAVARSLAEAALNLAKWRNQRVDCKSRNDLALTTVPGFGSFSATVDKASSNTLNMVATATTPSGAQFSLARKNVVTHELAKTTTKTVSANGGRSSYIDVSFPDTPMASASYMELSDGRTRALLKFGLGDIPVDSSVTSAQLTLTVAQASPNAGFVAIRRVLRPWDEPAVTWNTAGPGPWATPGGEFSAGVVDKVMVGTNPSYTWNVTALVDGWASRSYPNNGFLLSPEGPLQQARFHGFGSLTGPVPTMTVIYIPPC